MVGPGREADGLHSVRWVSTVFTEPHRNAAELDALREELEAQRNLTHERTEALNQEHLAAAAASQRRLSAAEQALARSQELRARTEDQLHTAYQELTESRMAWSQRERALMEQVTGLQAELAAEEARGAAREAELERDAATRASASQERSDELSVWRGKVVALEGSIAKLKAKAAHAEGRRRVEHAGFEADFSQYRKELAKLIDRVTKMEKRRRQPLATVHSNKKPESAGGARKRPGSLSLRCGAAPGVI